MPGLEVVKKIADGSVVEAYLANSAAGRVLVQVSRPELSMDAELFGRFLDHSTTTATRRKHPSLLSPERLHRGADGRCLLVTGPVSGRTAADQLAELGPLSSREAARWALRLCEALAYLHEHRVVHGHLAPKNIYLEGSVNEPEVRLLDTGLLLFRSVRSLKSSGGLVLVPPEYLSPERVGGARSDKASDVYGMGVLLYELLTGAPPFRGASADQTRELQLEARMPPLPPHLSVWTPVLERCLAKGRADRYLSMDALRQAIAALPLEDLPRGKVVLIDHVLTAGESLGNYDIDRLLGEGGMGHVYLARHRTLKRAVAIKVLRTSLANDEAHLTRFTQEAQAVNRVKHPSIVEVFDFVRETEAEGGRVYFVMELLEGESLRSEGNITPLTLKRAVRLFRQAADALAAVHAVGVVHRDLKPDNLFISKSAGGEEVMKVLDFGVARLRGLGGEPVPRVTKVGHVVGSLMWMAPEQVTGVDVDGQADVYSLATALYMTLARTMPFEGSSLREVVTERLRSPARPLGPSTFLGEPVPEALRSLVAECLERDPAKRPQSMRTVARRLRAIEDAPEGEVKALRSAWPRRAVLLAVGLSCAAASGWWVRAHGPHAPTSPKASVPKVR